MMKPVDGPDAISANKANWDYNQANMDYQRNKPFENPGGISFDRYMAASAANERTDPSAIAFRKREANYRAGIPNE